MAIKCGHCHKSHNTLLGVKECATNIATTDTAGQARERRERLKAQSSEEELYQEQLRIEQEFAGQRDSFLQDLEDLASGNSTSEENVLFVISVDDLGRDRSFEEGDGDHRPEKDDQTSLAQLMRETVAGAYSNILVSFGVGEIWNEWEEAQVIKKLLDEFDWNVMASYYLTHVDIENELAQRIGRKW